MLHCLCFLRAMLMLADAMMLICHVFSEIFRAPPLMLFLCAMRVYYAIIIMMLDMLMLITR